MPIFKKKKILLGFALSKAAKNNEMNEKIIKHDLLVSPLPTN